MRKHQNKKLFLILLLSAAFIFTFSHFGTAAYDSFISRNGKLKGETTIEPVNAGGKTESDAGLENGDSQLGPDTNSETGEQAVDQLIEESVIKWEDDDSYFDSLVEKPLSLEIPARSPFSLLKFIEAENMQEISSQSLSIIATALYEVVLPTNFTIIERYTGREIPEYARPGFEAKADYEKKLDFIFYNPNESDYSIKLAWENNSLRVYLEGQRFPYNYVVRIEDQEEFEPKIIKQYSPRLLPGQVEVRQNGQNGLLIKISRDVLDANGQIVQTEFISEDFYPPVYRIELYGLRADQENQQAGQIETDNIEDQPEDSSSKPKSDGSASGEMTGQNSSKPDDSSVPKESDLWGKPGEQPK